MKRKLVVVIPDLTENHRVRIREAAERHGFDCRFFGEPSESLPYLKDAEVVVGSDPVLSQNAPNLRWLCSPFAGTDRFIADDAFDCPGAELTNSSGAYGVTISEHVIMLLSEILRRQPEYQALVQRHGWRRDLPIHSIRDSRIAAESVGLDVTKYKMMAFVVSAVLAGMAGALYGFNFSTVAASKFKFDTSILVLVFVVLGGIGNIRGSVIAAALLTILPELLRAISDYRMLVYAIVLILVMIFTNNPTLKSAIRRILPKRRRGTDPEVF